MTNLDVIIRNLTLLKEQKENEDEDDITCVTNLDVIIRNLTLLKEQKENEDEDDIFWEDEFGNDLTYMIDCHPVFSDSTPCLNDVRNAEYDTAEYHENCEECKANWLLEEYE